MGDEEMFPGETSVWEMKRLACWRWASPMHWLRVDVSSTSDNLVPSSSSSGTSGSFAGDRPDGRMESKRWRGSIYARKFRRFFRDRDRDDFVTKQTHTFFLDYKQTHTWAVSSLIIRLLGSRSLHAFPLSLSLRLHIRRTLVRPMNDVPPTTWWAQAVDFHQPTDSKKTVLEARKLS